MLARSIVLVSLLAASAGALSANRDVPALALKPAAATQSAAKPAANASINRDQVQRRSDAQFKLIDGNHDGVVTGDELDAAQRQLNTKVEAIVEKRAEERFKALDANKDGQLSMAEFVASAARRPVSPDTKAAMARLDKNKDGKIDATEYRAAQLSNFDRLDVNHDGTLSVAERKARRR